MIEDIFIDNGQKKITVWNSIHWKDKTVDEETIAFLHFYAEKYPEQKQPYYDDIYGELFAIRYIPHLTKTSSRMDIFKLIDPVEGKDFTCFDLLGRNGNAEIKTIKTFLTQNNNSRKAPDERGSIPFEIFHRWIPENYNAMYAGWLLSAYDSIEYNKIKQEHNRNEYAETPGIYIFVLIGVNKRPYACIAFENIAALLSRLQELCPDGQNWGIPTPRTLRSASDRTYWDRYAAWKNYDKLSGGMVNNCWYVPFYSICDLATVTMIYENVDLDNELMNATYKCQLDIVKKRYEFLEKTAKRDGRDAHFNPEEFTKEETEIVEKYRAKGIRIQKRTYIQQSNEEFDKLKDGITFYRDGEPFMEVKLEPKKQTGETQT